MSETVKVEDKVRLVLPKKVKEVALAKLQGWVEADHKATKLIAEEVARRSNAAS